MDTIFTRIFATSVLIVLASAVSMFRLCKRAPQTWGLDNKEAFRRNLHRQQFALVTLCVFWMATVVFQFTVERTFLLSAGECVACIAAAAAIVRLFLLSLETQEFNLAHTHGPGRVIGPNDFATEECEHSLGPHVSFEEV